MHETPAKYPLLRAQDFVRGLHCFFYAFTDLGWHALEANGSSAGPRQEGFIWHSAPGCVHLPADTRVCFHRCDNATCMMQQACAPVCFPANQYCHTAAIWADECCSVDCFCWGFLGLHLILWHMRHA